MMSRFLSLSLIVINGCMSFFRFNSFWQICETFIVAIEFVLTLSSLRTRHYRSEWSQLSATLHSILVFAIPSLSEFIKYLLVMLLADLTRIMAKSKDDNELTYMWQQWHEETGRPLRSKFMRYVELSNEAARLNGKLSNISCL